MRFDEKDLESEEPEIKLCPACSVGVMLWDGKAYVCVDCGNLEEEDMDGEDDG